ncbi:MAG: hypothetical protein M0C28_07160 [Candidatus Moduliflexus flocculans]|nr:hypothetical protein [Candidatus Moduliflexus flocculans]
MHRLPRHELHHPGPGHDGQGPGLLVHHGEHAQPQAEYLERHPERAEEVARLTRERRMEWGATYNQPYESLLVGRAARARGLLRPPLAEEDVPRRRRPRLFQSRRPRPGRPDAPDPGQGRHPLHGHEPLSRGILPLGFSPTAPP